MKVEVKQVEGLTFVGRGESEHWVTLDGPSEFQGNEAAARPMELFLISLAGCTAMDVVSLLNKMRVEYDKLEVSADAERKEEHPRVFTKVKLIYRIYGSDFSDKDVDKIEKAINKSQDKYCSVSAMLKDVSDLTYEYKLITN